MTFSSPQSSPELNPLAVGDTGLSGPDASADADTEALAPMPAYKAAGETVLDFDGLLSSPLRLREDLAEGCGGQTWPAGMVLAKHMLRERRAEMGSARILELGAGGGLVGLAVALALAQDKDGKSHDKNHEKKHVNHVNHDENDKAKAAVIPPVYITDQLPMLSLMEHNIALNGLQDSARAMILDWGDPLPEEVRQFRPNLILAADCVYFEPAFPLLLQTLEELLALDDTVTVYFCFKKRRRADMHFLKWAQKRFSVVEVADVDRPVFSRQGLFLYTITRKAAKAAKATNPSSNQPNGANGKVVHNGKA